MRTRIMIFMLILLAGTLTLMQAQKQEPPAGGKPKDFKLPSRVSFTLPNGMAVTMVKYGTVPKVTLSAVVRTGAIDEGANELRLASLVGTMLKQGTTTKSAGEIRTLAATMGGSIDVGVGDDQTTVGGDVLSSSAGDFAALLADVLRNPKFPEADLPRLKNDQVRQLSLDLSNPQETTSERFQQILYPNHPYGRGFPTDTMLQSYTIDQVRSFYAANFGALRTHLYVVGQFDEKSLRAEIGKAFGGWTKGVKPTVNIPKAVPARQLVVMDRPGAPQSTLLMGLPVIDPSNPEYLQLSVTNSLLGGSFASRITSNIREQKGYTYSPYSYINSYYRTAFWAEAADVSTNVTGPSIKEILGEIKRLGAEPPSGDELNGIANYMSGTFVLRNSTRGGIVGQLSSIDFHGLPASYLTNYVKNVHAITPAKISAMAHKYIRPEDILIVITGDKKAISGQVSEYGTIIP